MQVALCNVEPFQKLSLESVLSVLKLFIVNFGLLKLINEQDERVNAINHVLSHAQVEFFLRYLL